jgi:hypothetical protein
MMMRIVLITLYLGSIVFGTMSFIGSGIALDELVLAVTGIASISMLFILYTFKGWIMPESSIRCKE